MNRLAIIGNSHVASLKLGWELVKIKSLRPTFFAAPGPGILTLEAQEDALVPTRDVVRDALKHTSGGLEQVRPNDFDMVLIYCTLRFEPLAPHFSRQAADCASLDGWRASTPGRLAAKVGPLTERPIVVAQTPMVAGPDQAGGLDDYQRAFERYRSLVSRESNVHLLAQPPATVAPGFRTLAQFSVGSERLAVSEDTTGVLHDDDDRYHMNAEYGALWWKTFAGELESLVARAD